MKNKKTVYMSFATDIINSGHLNIIEKASELGDIIAGIQTDEVIAQNNRFPLVDIEERIRIFSSIKNISKVVVQDTLSYKKILNELKPDYVVHGDDWVNNELSFIREEVIKILSEYGGKLVEFPYTYNNTLTQLNHKLKIQSGLPEVRRPKLKRLLKSKDIVSIIEAHSGLSGLIAENTVVRVDEKLKSFDGMWVSSLCDSTMKGKPDIELVDFTSRISTIDEIMDVTTKPIILDGDTGGLIEHFVYNIKTIERIGVSAVIIEDKKGLKKNSLFGTDVSQQQDSIENFSAKISAGKRALISDDFMLIARIESLILEIGLEDALKRANAYVNAGADGIMIHSRKKEPDQVFEFAKEFKKEFPDVPLAVVPTTYCQVTEKELADHGINIVIYANHLIRSAYPAMLNSAKSILSNGSAVEASKKYCVSIKDILGILPNR